MESNSSSSSTSIDSGFQCMGSSAAKKFIAAYDNGRNSNEMKDALTELWREHGDDKFYSTSIFSQLLRRLDCILSSAAESKETGTLVVVILQYLVQSSKENEKVRISIRDDYGFIIHLASLFNPHRNSDAELILECFELISRGLLISWKAPYLQEMINKCFIYIYNKDMEPRIFDTVLQLLINLCKKNPSFIIFVRQHKDFHEVWAYIRKLFDQESSILMTHLLYLLEPTIPICNFISGHEIVSQGIKVILERWQQSSSNNIDDPELSNQLMKVSHLMESILDKMKPIYQSVAAEEGKASSPKTNLNLEKHKVVSDTKAIMMDKLIAINNFVKTDFLWSSSIIQELLGFILILFPEYTRRMLSTDFYMIAFEIIDRIVTRSGTDVKSFTACLKLFHYLAQHLSVMDSPKKNELGSHLCQTLGRVKLILENSQEAIERNITCLQLMSCLAEVHATTDLVLDKLNIEILENLLDILSHEDESLPPQMQLKKSICAVELLNLLSQYSKVPQIINLIMKSISSHTTYTHISNCIINAPEEIVARALHITASVGFYGKKSSAGVAKALMIKRDRPLCVKDYSLAVPQTFGPKSVIGATHVMETLRAVGELVEMDTVEETGMLSDIFSWYQLNKELHEHEIQNLNNHVYQQNKTIAHLKCLIERQTEFVSRRLALKDEKEFQIITLQHRLEKITKEMMTLTTQTTSEIERLKESLKLKTDAHRDVSEKLKALEASFEALKAQSKEALKERSNLTEKVKNLKTENKELSSDFSKIKKELSESKLKISRLDGEVKKKNDELLTVSARLEEKTKVLETIQGVMGVRMGSF